MVFHFQKRKTFISHTSGSMGSSVQGALQVTWAGVSEFSCFLGCRILSSALVPVIVVC